MQEGVLHQQMPRDASLSLLEVYIQSLPFLSDVLSSGQHRCLVHDDIGTLASQPQSKLPSHTARATGDDDRHHR